MLYVEHFALHGHIHSQHCHPERSEGSAFAFVVAVAFAFALALLLVIPEGNLLLPSSQRQPPNCSTWNNPHLQSPIEWN
jgi:hypothetical protein